MRSSLLQRWSKFSLVGFGGFLLQIAALALLTRVFEWHYTVATLAAIELAILHNFVGDSCFTWRDRVASGRREVARRFVRYQASRSIVLTANLFITSFIIWKMALPPEVANTAAAVMLSAVNFLITDHLVFAK